jgi:hypothetical protein
MVGKVKRPGKGSPSEPSALSRRRQSRVQRWLDLVSIGSLRRRQLLLMLLAAAVVLLVLGIAAATADIARAAGDGKRGEDALFAAVAQFDSAAGSGGQDKAHLREAKAELVAARRDFAAMDSRLTGVLLLPARLMPFIRVQVRGADDMAQVGIELSAAGEHLADVASGLLAPSDSTLPLKDALGQFRALDSAAQASTAALQDALSRIGSLSTYRLIGPVASARTTLFAKLPHIEQRVAGGDQALRAFEDFLGAAGPRRYLLLSQNPDEVRPTGGFIGTYGLLQADGGHLSIAKFDDTNQFLATYPNVYVPESSAPSVFQIGDSDQTFGNVNATPDWPTAAKLATQLWREADQPSVDGVISLTPTFLARVVGVLGPVAVPDYGETITASNLEARVDYWAHQNPGAEFSNRKEFLSELSRIVLQEALDAPAAKWHVLAAAASAGFHQSEAMVWSTDPTIQHPVAANDWDHASPAAQATGDYFYDSEFEFAAKNGRALHRVFQHSVALHPDGSGVAATTVTITNTESPGVYSPSSPLYNLQTEDYLVSYGPAGASLDKSSDSPFYPYEAALNGHPASGWLMSPDPLTTSSVKIVWNSPHLLRYLGDGEWEYHLTFPKLPAHQGDSLKLSVVLPPHWRWKGQPPPSEIPLNTDVSQTWLLMSS